MDRHVLDEVEVLDRDRHAQQRGQVLRVAGGEPGLLLAGLAQGPVGGHRDERPQTGVEPFDALQVVLGDLDRRKFTRTYGSRLLKGGKIVNVRHATER
ncbi:hypothetical protein GCM10027612_71040 [Microbispora bryophytorum subsp. camponoti]